MELKGTFTAMVTPFLDDQLDEEGLSANIRRQIDAGIAGLVLLGTTGEAATLSDAEQHRVIEIGVREGKGKTLIIAGTGSNSTRHAVEKTRLARELGADAALIVTPYYNKPSQEGIYRHFASIANEVDLPIIVYNIFGRTGVNIETATLLKIAQLPSVIGVKEASGNISQAADVMQMVVRARPSFSLLSGDDALTLPMMALGATGVVSVVSNLIPKKMVALTQAALESRFDEARRIHEELLAFFKLAFIEVNPVPIKEAMNFYGLAAGACRLPLCEMRAENREKLIECLREWP